MEITEINVSKRKAEQNRIQQKAESLLLLLPVMFLPQTQTVLTWRTVSVFSETSAK